MQNLLALCTFCLSAAFLPVLALQLAAQDATVLRERLHQASLLNSLDRANTRPWHLLLSFELFDPSRHSSHTGTVEEWWAGPRLHKTVYVYGASSWTSLTNSQGLFRSGDTDDLPELARILHNRALNPLPSAKSIDEATPLLEEKRVGQLGMDCISLTAPAAVGDKTHRQPGDPVYCMDHDKASLRITLERNFEEFTRINLGSFVGSFAPIDQSIRFNGFLAARSHIVKLETELVAEMNLESTTGLTRVDVVERPAGSHVVPGKILTKVNPIYPASAKANHISGSVLFRAIISEDGHPTSIKVIFSPDPDLTRAALEAVSKWTYQPYLVDEKPTLVETEIAVNFAFSR